MRVVWGAIGAVVLSFSVIFGLVSASSAKDVRGFPGAKAVMRAGPFSAVYEGRQRGLYPDWKLDGMRIVALGPLMVPQSLKAGDVLHAEELRIRKKSIRLTQPLKNTAKDVGEWKTGTAFDLYLRGRQASYCRRDYKRNDFNVPAGFYCVADTDRDGRLDSMRFKGNSSAAPFEDFVPTAPISFEEEALSEEIAWKRVLVVEAVGRDKLVVTAPIIDWVAVREELRTFPSFLERLQKGEGDRITVTFDKGKASLDYEGARFLFEKTGRSGVMVIRTSDFAPWAETVRGRGVALIETRFPVKPN